MGMSRRLLPEISSSSDNAADVSISGFLTVRCSPQLPAAIAHHVVWKPLRPTAAIHSCEVLGCLWGLHRAALPCHRLLDCSLQQGTNSWCSVGSTGISTQGLDWNPRFLHNAVGKWFMASSKAAPGENKLEVLLDRYKWNKLTWFEIHLYRGKSGVRAKRVREWVTRKQKEKEMYRR